MTWGSSGSSGPLWALGGAGAQEPGKGWLDSTWPAFAYCGPALVLGPWAFSRATATTGFLELFSHRSASPADGQEALLSPCPCPQLSSWKRVNLTQEFMALYTLAFPSFLSSNVEANEHKSS